MEIIQPKPGTVFARLQAKIKKDLEIDLSNFKRSYVGHWQRSAGAWVWVARVMINGELSHWDCGSSFSATELLKATKLVLSEIDEFEIFPEF